MKKRQETIVIDIKDNKEESTTTISTKPKRKHKGLIISLSLIGALAILIATVIIVNQLTVYPFISLFRWMIGLSKEQGNIGSYAEQIEKVKEGPVAIVETHIYGHS